MKWKWLLFWNLLTLILFFSFFWEGTQALWQTLDILFFKWMNSPLEGSPKAQLFWAFSNLRAADWIEDGVFILLFIIYIKNFKGKTRQQKIYDLMTSCLFAAIVDLYINHGLFRTWVRIEHLSPSLLTESFVSVADIFSWTRVKVSSRASFPGDHGTTALFFPAVMAGLRAPRPLLLISFAIGLFYCLPRMVVGAHGISDLIVGSGGIVIFFSSWFFCTPLFNISSSVLQKTGSYVGKKCLAAFRFLEGVLHKIFQRVFG